MCCRSLSLFLSLFLAYLLDPTGKRKRFLADLNILFLVRSKSSHTTANNSMICILYCIYIYSKENG